MRRIEIGVTKGDYQIFNDLHGEQSADAFARSIRAGAAISHGAAGVAWIEYLIKDRASIKKKWAEYIAGDERQKAIEVIEKGGDMQQMRVYGHMQLIAFAGKLATETGMTGWDADAPRVAMRDIYRHWLRDNQAESNERMEAIHHIRIILQQHKASFSRHPNDKVIGDRLGHIRPVNRVTGDIIQSDRDNDGNEIPAEALIQDTHLAYGYFVSTDIFRKVFCARVYAKDHAPLARPRGHADWPADDTNAGRG